MTPTLDLEADADTAVAAPAPRPWLTFVLGDDLYAIGIDTVREIIGYGGLTAVPKMPACIRGVINLRGAVVPVLDLQARLERRPSAVGKRTCVVIVELPGERQPIGVVVDAVLEVLDIAAGGIEPAPAFGARVRPDFIAGIGKVGGRFVILLETRQVLAIDEIAASEAIPA